MPEVWREAWGIKYKLDLDGLVREGDIAAVRDALEKGDNPTATTLLIAILNRHMEIAKLLIEKGADVNIKDSAGKTASMHALNWKHTYIAYRLSLLEKRQEH